MKTIFNRHSVQQFLAAFIISCFLGAFTIGCSQEEIVDNETQTELLLEREISNLQNSSAHIKIPFPSAEEPGPPLYMRLASQLNQIYVVDGWVVIAFYRNPDCVNEEFNLLELFDVPAAFFCDLLTSGFVIKERNAGPEVFPIMVQSTGSAIPFWFIPQTEFEDIASDGIVSITELRSTDFLEGTATSFHEILKPRDPHLVQIQAEGNLTDGRLFTYHVTHVRDETRNISLSIR